jgi:alpha-glucosidase
MFGAVFAFTAETRHIDMAYSWRALLRAGMLASSLLSSQTALAQSSNSTKPTSTSASVLTATIAGQVVTYSPQFTVPASADIGVTLQPNVLDPNATNAQNVCPGYNASNIVNTTNGFSALLTLAGKPCK